MSGCSDISTCPICGGDMETYTDYKPVDTVSMICYHCGFEGYTRYGMLPGDVRDERMRDGGMKPEQPLSLEDRKRNLASFKETFGDLTPEQEAAYLGIPVAAGAVKPKVLIAVRGGVAYVENCPEGVEVRIVDYDNMVQV